MTPSQPDGGIGKGVVRLEARQEALKGWRDGGKQGAGKAGKERIISSDL